MEIRLLASEIFRINKSLSLTSVRIAKIKSHFVPFYFRYAFMSFTYYSPPDGVVPKSHSEVIRFTQGHTALGMYTKTTWYATYLIYHNCRNNGADPKIRPKCMCNYIDIYGF